MTLNRNNRGLLVLAIAAGLVTAILVFVALANSESDSGKTAAPTAATSSAVVAQQAIPAGTEITVDMVKVVAVPDDLLVPGAFAETTPVVGEVARYPIAQGEQLSPAKVGAEAGGNGLDFVVPKGLRGVAIEVAEVTNVGGLLLTGNRVDITVAFTPADQDGPTEVYTIIRDVEVLSVAQAAQEAVPAGPSDATAGEGNTTSGQLPEDLKGQPKAATVTVALDDFQVRLLSCVQDHPRVARVWLSLRPFGEPAPAEKVQVPDRCVIY
jgi:pilus assembly protein CpaB